MDSIVLHYGISKGSISNYMGVVPDALFNVLHDQYSCIKWPSENEHCGKRGILCNVQTALHLLSAPSSITFLF